MDLHLKFATWLASAHITPADDILRRWWAGLDGFKASASDVVNLVQLAHETDSATVEASRFYNALQKQDAALLPAHRLAVAVLATAKLHTIVEQDSALGSLASLLSAVSFPLFETQPAYRIDLAELAEKSLAKASRARANLNDMVEQLEEKPVDSEEEPETDEEDQEDNEEKPGLVGLKRILAVTAEETNILWWIFGGRSRDTNEAFIDIPDEVIPFVAAKELADLTTLLPGHVAVSAFADRVCQTGRSGPSKSVGVTTAIKKLPAAFVQDISQYWVDHQCLPLCRLSRQIVGLPSLWGKSQKLPVAFLSQLFYRECLVPRAWKKASS